MEKFEIPPEEKGESSDSKDFDIILDKDGLCRKIYDDEKQEVNYELIGNIEIAINFLGDPVKLLEKIINSLIEAALRNKEQISQLQFALKLVKALSEEEKGDNKD